MSRFGNRGVRCDHCGKIANNPLGVYERRDGSCGYIRQPEWERFPGGDPTVASIQTENDICQECSVHYCQACGNKGIEGGKCKACKYEQK